mmetsp:Transcript_77017/g.222708  ORF Transcript_77017/g.222708 Transcript_77017/m.222708 type:complete len:156 (-) Transcript_77017:394-861(-)
MADAAEVRSSGWSSQVNAALTWDVRRWQAFADCRMKPHDAAPSTGRRQLSGKIGAGRRRPVVHPLSKPQHSTRGKMPRISERDEEVECRAAVEQGSSGHLTCGGRSTSQDEVTEWSSTSDASPRSGDAEWDASLWMDVAEDVGMPRTPQRAPELS